MNAVSFSYYTYSINKVNVIRITLQYNWNNLHLGQKWNKFLLQWSIYSIRQQNNEFLIREEDINIKLDVDLTIQTKSLSLYYDQ